MKASLGILLLSILVSGKELKAEPVEPKRGNQLEDRLIHWRRDFHQHPELSNRETRTAAIVAEHLRRLNLDVQTKVAHNGVVGLLRGRKDSPVIALRADMDALPVTEALDLPFSSKVQVQDGEQRVGVMHACGHDAHTAILMGVAEVLAAQRDCIPGTVKFIFQGAEEGVPLSEEGGASMMIKEGVLKNPRPDAILGFHVVAGLPVGVATYGEDVFMASSDHLRIKVIGRQTHGGLPWRGIDPIVPAAQVILGLQALVSREVSEDRYPSVLSIGTIHGGTRANIIPGEVVMEGTLRTFDAQLREQLKQRIKKTVMDSAARHNAEAEVDITPGPPVTWNHPELTHRLVPVLQKVLGEDQVWVASPVTVTEDFAWYLDYVPGFYFYLGATPPDSDLENAAPNHSPDFFLDESSLILGVKTLVTLTLDYLEKSTEGSSSIKE